MDDPVRLIKTASDPNGTSVELPLDYMHLEFPDNPTQDEERDRARYDDLDALRYLVAGAELESNDHTLGEENTNVSLSDVDGTTADPNSENEIVRWPIDVRLARRPMASLGEAGRLFFCGPYVPDSGDSEPFTRTIADDGFEGLLADFEVDSRSRGRVNFHPDEMGVSAGGYDGGSYPDVPPGALLGEFVTLVPPDPTRPSEDPDGPHRRVYGRLNINTADRSALQMLPWDELADYRFSILGQQVQLDPNEAIENILSYRDLQMYGMYKPDWAPNAGINYSGGRDADAASGIENLRAGNQPGFLAAGEVAIPLADYTIKEMMDATGNSLEELKQAPIYLEARDALYRDVANLLTVNSDTFAVNLIVQARTRNDDGDPLVVHHTLRYLVILDRSNCDKPGDLPAVLLFTPVQ